MPGHHQLRGCRSRHLITRGSRRNRTDIRLQRALECRNCLETVVAKTYERGTQSLNTVNLYVADSSSGIDKGYGLDKVMIARLLTQGSNSTTLLYLHIHEWLTSQRSPSRQLKPASRDRGSLSKRRQSSLGTCSCKLAARATDLTDVFICTDCILGVTYFYEQYVWDIENSETSRWSHRFSLICELTALGLSGVWTYTQIKGETAQKRTENFELVEQGPQFLHLLLLRFLLFPLESSRCVLNRLGRSLEHVRYLNLEATCLAGCRHRVLLRCRYR